MSDRQKMITIYVMKAIHNFNVNEKYLIENDLSERCICAKFMSYLEHLIKKSEFEEYDVDVEYNRGNDGKDYLPKESEGRKMVVDLIVHNRKGRYDGNFDNLVCIEMKKTGRDMTADKERLRNMTDPDKGFNYEAGFMIVIDKRKNILKIDETFYNSGSESV